VKQAHSFRLERYKEPHWLAMSQHKSIDNAMAAMRDWIEHERHEREWVAEAVQFDADGMRI
jgi:hypothetical protein